MTGDGSAVSDAEVSAGEVSDAEVLVAEISVAGVCVAEVSVAELSLADVCVAEVSVAEVSVAEVSVAKISLADVSVAEVSVARPAGTVGSLLFVEVSVESDAASDVGSVADTPVLSGIEVEMVEPADALSLAELSSVAVEAESPVTG